MSLEVGVNSSARSQTGAGLAESESTKALQQSQWACPLSVHAGPVLVTTGVKSTRPGLDETPVTLTAKSDHWHGGGPAGAVVVGEVGDDVGGSVAVVVVVVGMVVVDDEPADSTEGGTGADPAVRLALAGLPPLRATPVAEAPTATMTPASTTTALRSTLGVTTILPTRSTKRIGADLVEEKGSDDSGVSSALCHFWHMPEGQPIWSMADCSDCT